MSTEVEVLQFLEKRGSQLADEVRSLKDLRTKLSRDCGRLEKEIETLQQQTAEYRDRQAKLEAAVVKERRVAEREAAKLQTKPEPHRFAELLRMTLQERAKRIFGVDVDLDADSLMQAAKLILNQTNLATDEDTLTITFPPVKIVRG